jgi:thioesterase domain-containing protein
VSVRDLMSQLRALDVKVWMEEDRLRVSAPEGALTPSIKDEMKQRKEEIVSFLEVAAQAEAYPPSIVPLQPGGDGLPVFAVPGHNGDVFCYVRLAAELGATQPFFALQPPGLDGRRPPLERVVDLADTFADDIDAFRPEGPVVVAGFCLGGTVAFETARRLRARGRTIAMLALFGGPCPTSLKPIQLARARTRYLASRLAHHTRTFVTLPQGERLDYLRGRLRGAGAAVAPAPPLPDDETERNRVRVETATVAAVRAYHPEAYDGRITLYFPDASWRHSEDRPEDWTQFAVGGVEERIGPDGCNGDRMLREYAPVFAGMFAADLTGRRERE